MSTPHTEPAPAVAAFFDLDKTIIAKSSALAFSRPFFDQGLINRRTVLKSSYAQFLFLVSGADRDQVERMRKHVIDMCNGWDVEQVQAIVAETLEDVVAPLVFAEAAELIDGHRALGHRIVIVSASGEEVAGPIGRLVGADDVLATQMRIIDGRYAGEIEFYCYGDAKAQAMRDYAAENGIDLERSFAYSDSSTDIPMLEAVGHPTAINPDRLLRRTATARSWPVLAFSNPVPIGTRLPRKKTLLTAGGAAVVAAFAGGLAYGLLTRRH